MSLAAFLVPTGIGASIGGFAGDASCYARELSDVCPLIVNPNVVNAAIFSGITDKMLYAEGFAIDEFFKGNIAFRPVKSNRIGIIFDKAIPQSVLNVHINTLNAMKMIYGYDILEPVITSDNVDVEFSLKESGISSGGIKNQQTLIEAGRKLKEQGATSIGVVCLFDEPEEDNYAQGNGVDIVGGVEAIISHILVKELMLPVAHSPAFEDITIPTEIVDPRAAAEYITPTFLPCIIHGLSQAPALIPIKKALDTDQKMTDLKALIMPYNSLGCVPVLQANAKNIPIIAVKENCSVLDVSADKLNIDVIEVQTYAEAKDTLKNLILAEELTRSFEASSLLYKINRQS